MNRIGCILALSVALVVTVSSCAVAPTTTPACNVWFGVAANPEADEDWDTALIEFEEGAGRTVDIVHYYKRGQDMAFPEPRELYRQNQPNRNRILFYNWKPEGLTWRAIADGAADPYLKLLASHLNTTMQDPFFLSLNAEMEDEVIPTAGSGQTARDYRDFYRHTVTTLRSGGVDNAVFVMNYTGSQKWAETPWFEELYPGDDVVDWIAQDPYAYDLQSTPNLAQLVDQSGRGTWRGFYSWAAEQHPDKPQMLAEWGVDDPAGAASLKPMFFSSAAELLTQYSKIRALIYWNHSGMDPDGSLRSVGRTAIDSSPTSLEAFRQFVHSPIMTSQRECPLKAT